VTSVEEKNKTEDEIQKTAEKSGSKLQFRVAEQMLSCIDANSGAFIARLAGKSRGTYVGNQEATSKSDAGVC
jgi:hypothetical protein